MRSASSISVVVMVIAIFSDIHANFEALAAVWSDLQKRGVTAYFCLGDVVDYGASPQQCCTFLRDNQVPTLLGNHDHAVLGERTPFNKDSDNVNTRVWTRHVLDSEMLGWLSSLPLTLTLPEFNMTLCHANLSNPGGWKYVLGYESAEATLGVQQTQLSFVGHTHETCIYERNQHDGTLSFRKDCEVVLKSGCKYIINVGSVGQPRDGDPRSCYVLYDTENQAVRFIRVEYDIAQAQEKIRQAGLSWRDAVRLSRGM